MSTTEKTGYPPAELNYIHVTHLVQRKLLKLHQKPSFKLERIKSLKKNK